MAEECCKTGFELCCSSKDRDKIYNALARDLGYRDYAELCEAALHTKFLPGTSWIVPGSYLRDIEEDLFQGMDVRGLRLELAKMLKAAVQQP